MVNNVHVGDKVYIQAGSKAGFTGTVIDINENDMALIQFANSPTEVHGWVKITFLARLHV